MASVARQAARQVHRRVAANSEGRIEAQNGVVRRGARRTAESESIFRDTEQHEPLLYTVPDTDGEESRNARDEPTRALI